MSDDNFDLGLEFENHTEFFNLTVIEPSMTERYAGIAIYCGFSFASVFANIAMLVLIYKKGKRKSTFDLTIGSLAVADLVTSLFFLANTIMDAITLKDHSYWTPSYTKAFKILSNGSMYCIIASILHILSITIERLFGISYPFLYRQKVTKSRVKIIIGILWILSAGITVLDEVVWQDAMKGTVLATIIFSTGVLLCLMYGIIAYKALMRKRQQLAASRKEARVIQNSVAVTLCFIFCTFPVAFADLRFNPEFSERYGYLCSSLVAVKLLLDPLLYFFLSLWREKKARRKRYWLGTTITSCKTVGNSKAQDGVSKYSVKSENSEKTTQVDNEIGILNLANESGSTSNEAVEDKSNPQTSSQSNEVVTVEFHEEQSLSTDIPEDNNNRFQETVQVEAVNEEEAVISDGSTESTDLSKMEHEELKMVEFKIDSYFSHINSYFEDLRHDFEHEKQTSL